MSRFQTFAVSDLRLGSECQTRAESNQDAINEYAELYRVDPDRLPPPSVWLVAGAPQVVDGYHRVTAALVAGVKLLRVEIAGEGSADDAAWFACSVNQGHGIRRTNADKRRSVMRALALRPHESDRAIGAWCGVHNETVKAARVTESVTCTPNSAKSLEPDSPNRRTWKDGKSYPVPAQQPKREPEPVAQPPEASLPSVIPAKAVEPVNHEESDTETPYVCPSIGATATEYADAIRLLRTRWERTSRKTRAHRVGERTEGPHDASAVGAPL